MGLAENLPVMLACYGYIVLLIYVSGKLDDRPDVSKKVSRKFLHSMIGNLPFILPFFTDSIYPFLVASPFILVTYLASPLSPFKGVTARLGELMDIAEEGHPTGLIFYAISYSVLALLYGVQPYVVAAGIFPMAYGDSSAALVGERYGQRHYKVWERKSLEGSLAMFTGSVVSLTVATLWFSRFYPLQLSQQLPSILALSLVVTLAEACTPKGLDNITVPLLGVVTYILTGGYLA